MAPEQENLILAHVRHGYGWFGGMGDPPDDETVLALIRATLAVGRGLSYPEDEARADQLLKLVRQFDSRGFGSRAAINDLPDDAILAVIRETAAFLEEHGQTAPEPRR